MTSATFVHIVYAIVATTMLAAMAVFVGWCAVLCVACWRAIRRELERE
jgi:hypothetical protein